MKPFRLALPAVAALALAACATLPHATVQDVQLAQDRWPGTTVEQLEAGRQVYAQRCSGCHNLHLPSEKSPEEWPKLLADMEKDAHVKPEEHSLIERYLTTMSARAHLGPAAK